MALLDIFKKKKKPEKKVERKKAPEKAPKKPVSKKPAAPAKQKKSSFFDSYKILVRPHVTEKATDLVGKNQYVFEVFPEAGKQEIKKAVEGVYGVDVESVKTVNIPAKKRRLGRIEGFRKGYKKAVVKVKEGQKIEILPR